MTYREAVDIKDNILALPKNPETRPVLLLLIELLGIYFLEFVSIFVNKGVVQFPVIWQIWKYSKYWKAIILLAKFIKDIIYVVRNRELPKDEKFLQLVFKYST